MTHQHEIDKMRLINENLEKLNQKKGQYEGALGTLKTQAQDMSNQIKNDYSLTIQDIPTTLDKMRNEISSEEKRIINEFTKLYNLEHIRHYIKIAPPFTVEAIYEELQNNLLAVKSQAEGEIKGIEQQQEKLKSTLKNDFDLDINNIDQHLQNMSQQMQSLASEIQTKYDSIMQDDEIRKLLQ